MTLTDRTLVLKYQSGLEVRGNYGATSVAWEALSGPDRGSTGTEAAFVTYAVESGRQSLFDVGTIEIQNP